MEFTKFDGKYENLYKPLVMENPEYRDYAANPVNRLFKSMARNAPAEQLQRVFSFDQKSGNILVGFKPLQKQQDPLAGIKGQAVSSPIDNAIRNSAPINFKPFSGVSLDKSTLSGKVTDNLEFREDGGALLAVFKEGQNEVGYMRAAQPQLQAGKMADNINLRSNTQRAGPVATNKARI